MKKLICLLAVAGLLAATTSYAESNAEYRDRRAAELNRTHDRQQCGTSQRCRDRLDDDIRPSRGESTLTDADMERIRRAVSREIQNEGR